ncbi:hypothetical protein C2845_PM01G21900 [Panicum miliaceum]|uniref:Cathepsin propeptide inhibitor domain-containing protein n=1 Tax=Panicum miliaceum TaxID=4540 RepID=A0A3L6TJD5_PANMI|nr:hypothetical protein C2845_PM01G21900 [Panicum miliaceum]
MEEVDASVDVSRMDDTVKADRYLHRARHEPAAAAAAKFTTDDLDSEEALCELYERWAREVAPGLNIFADLSDDEFRDYKCRTTAAAERCNRNDLTAPVPVKRRGSDLPLPVSIDWRTKTCSDQPCLGLVKDQGGLRLLLGLRCDTGPREPPRHRWGEQQEEAGASLTARAHGLRCSE